MILVLTSRCIQGDEFSINVVDRLNEKSLPLDLSTSIVISPFCCSVRKSDTFFPAALARYSSTSHELCRRSCFRYPMSSRTGGELLVQIQWIEPSSKPLYDVSQDTWLTYPHVITGNILVSQSFQNPVLWWVAWPFGYIWSKRSTGIFVWCRQWWDGPSRPVLLVQLLISLNGSFRRYCHHTCRLVSSSFDRSLQATDTVSFFISLFII